MQLLFTVLLFFTFANAAYDAAPLNKFSGDVDIYDMGTMGRGKNAGSWHRSPEDNQEVFYYLAMQPWRHLVWTIKEGNDWFTYVLNEDASNIPAAPSGKNPSPKVSNNDANDYCRKVYTTPMATFDIDWDRVDAQSKLESLEINGITCYKYPAKVPLENIYLQQQYTRPRDVAGMTPCRYDFIGGKSITFRSFNSFSSVFIGNSQPNGYQLNRTRCNIDPTPNNVNTDLAIVLGISDATIVQKINSELSLLKNIPNVQQAKVYYRSGEAIKSETIGSGDWENLKLKQVNKGSVDAAINAAKNDLVKRTEKGAVKRGTMIVLMDQSMASTFDAETAFDRNFITVHTILYNPNGDKQMTSRARTLLSLGQHHHEFTSATEIQSIVTEMYNGVRANLTERCDRANCDGFCDARDRCTCPMCCENTCFFTYCDTAKATCTPWPKGKPKEKITCKDDCIGKQECRDLEGCVYKEYNEGCKPRAKCMKPYCDENNKCQQKSGCEQDKTPSYENKCWSYSCDEATGNCVREKSGAECPKLTDLCEEYVCDSDLTCRAQKKVCVKTSPYIEMKCYQAKCNKKTGMCENVLKCDVYSSCGATGTKDLCTCDPKTFDCKCDTNTPGYCRDDQICNSTYEHETNPICVDVDCTAQEIKQGKDCTKCKQDVYRIGCTVRECNEETGEIVEVPYNCDDRVEFKFMEMKNGKSEVSELAQKYCADKYEKLCDEGDCYGALKKGVSESAACGKCQLDPTPATRDGKVDGQQTTIKTYTVTYSEDCSHLYPKCDDGKESPIAGNYFGKNDATCKEIDGEYQCVLPNLSEDDAFNYCASCYPGVCNLAKEYVTYTFNPKTGYCSERTLNTPPECSDCNAENTGYVATCKDKKFEQTYTYTASATESKDFKYTIPKTCINDQCIPVREYNCMSGKDNGIDAIVEQLRICAKEGTLVGKYHYSPDFDELSFFTGKKQSEEFMANAEKQTYCEWEFKLEACHTCSILNPESKDSTLQDIYECEVREREDEKLMDPKYHEQYKLTCNAETNECIPPKDMTCPTKQCQEKVWVNGDCVDRTAGANKGNLCAENRTIIAQKYSDYEALMEENKKHGKPETPTLKCKAEANCVEDTKCPITVSNCQEAYTNWTNGLSDFGCWIPNIDCNEETYHCTFVKMTYVMNDSLPFRKRDGVVYDDLCYQYRCEETKHPNGTWEHHWVQTEESKAELYAQPNSICDTVKCDPKTGKAVHEEMTCTPVEAFKMTEAQAQCFECKCSYVDGKPQIVMRSNLGAETYELDACGNCIVRDRQTGEQKNEHVECVLAVTVNLTGAIAGATVAASVVFGLIGAMVVVSIGAFQTYQLVASAMKNVISTTLENPEFVAADNEATNVLNNE